MTLAFVIPVRNDEHRLAGCLASIRQIAGDARGIEVVVVDNGSSDRSADVASAAGARVVSAPGVRVGELRNRGAAVSTAALLAFVDADHLLRPGWLEAVTDVMSDASVGATGALCLAPPGGTWVQRFFDALRARQEGRRDVEWLGAGNLVVRRVAFEALGGFDTGLETCEDVDLCNRLRHAGWRLVSDSRAENVHLGDPETLGRLFRSELWRGRDNLRVSLRGPLTWRAVASLVLPVANLLAMASIVLAPVLWLAAGVWPLAAGTVVLAATFGLRALRIWSRLQHPSSSDAARAVAMAGAYESARALALVWRFGHHRRRRDRGRG